MNKLLLWDLDHDDGEEPTEVDRFALPVLLAGRKDARSWQAAGHRIATPVTEGHAHPHEGDAGGEAEAAADGQDPDAAPTRSLTTAQAGAQITRGNYRWGGRALGTAVGPITFGFRTSPPSYSTSDRDLSGTFSRFTAAQEAAARSALDQWASLANITFTDLGSTNNATILFGNYASSTDGSGAFAYYPGSTSSQAQPGDVWVNTRYESTTNVNPGTYEYLTLIHEIGHAIGLQHPGDYNASGTSVITYGNSASYVQDTRMYTIMSYFDEDNTGGSFTAYGETPMIADVAAVQRLYGANTNTRSGNTVYGFNSNAGSPFSITSPGQRVTFAIYDTGGSDTLDASGYAQRQTIDLNPESFSSIGGDTANVSIAAGVRIERAVGGAGDDTLILSAAGAGTVAGGGGTDTFRGSVAAWQGSTVEDLGLREVLDVVDADPSSFSYDWNGRSLTLMSGAARATVTLRNDPVGRLVLGSDPGGGIDLTLARQNPHLGDFGGDGRSDVLWRNADGTLVAWDMNGRTVTGSGVLGNDPTWVVVGIGDFDGDHSSDLLQRNTATGQVLATALDGRTGLGAGLIGGDLDWKVAATGDFNGDGRSDILWRHKDGILVQWLMNGRAAIATAVIGADPAWSVVATGDFNGDGMTDILQRNSATGQVLETEMNGSTGLSAGLIGGDLDWKVVATGDFNGDGRSDILWRHTNGTLVEWEMNGRSLISGGAIGTDPNSTVVGTGDFNNDGMSDILQRNALTGQVTETTMNGRTALSSGVIGGDLGWSVVSGQSAYA